MRNLKRQAGFTIVELFVVLFYGACIFGYIANIVRIFTATWPDTISQVSVLLVFRIIGVFGAPLGVILGYIPN